METSGMRRVMGMLVVLMLVAVAAQGQAAVTDVHPTNIFKSMKCAAKCGVQCAQEGVPSLIKLCFGLCMTECKHQPSKVVYNCTSACAKSAFDSNPRDDVKMVNAYVDSCYESCKNLI